MAQDLDLRTRVEVDTLHEFLEEVDFYALLQVAPSASMDDIARAFAAESKRFHPDRYFGVRDALFLRKLTAIYRKLSEAYSVLKDPDLRSRYDERAGHGGVSKAALQEEASQERKTRRLVCSTRRGRRYYELASTARRAGDLNGLVMNLQFALSFESDNEVLRQELAEAREELDATKSRESYKVRL